MEAHQTLKTVYELVHLRVTSFITSPDRAVEVPPEIFKGIQFCVIKIAEDINNADDSSLFENLRAISTIGYVATGNGFYLLCYISDVINRFCCIFDEGNMSITVVRDALIQSLR